MKLITVNYIVHDRPHYFKTIFKQLIKIKDKNKKKVGVNILVSRENEPDIDVSLLNDNNIASQIIYQPHLGRHYMGKVEKGIDLSGKYSISLDEDVFINNHIWDFMIENHDILDDERNLLLTPLLSTGVPTVEWFIEQFFNEDEKLMLFEKFKNTYIKESNCTPPGCEVLNKCTINSKNSLWDKEYFYSEVGKMQTYYKGVHPVRISGEIQSDLVDLVLKYKNRLLEKKNYEMFFDKTRPYFCNNIFMIKTDIWKKIVYDSSLFVDKFDEVPINKYKNQNNLNFVFIKNAFGVHPGYNWIGMSEYRTLSDRFFEGMADE